MTGHARSFATALCDDYRGTVTLIDTVALCDNVRRLAKLANRPICLPLKANAYGHDALLCAKVLAYMPEVAAFAVAVLTEALLLREAGHSKPIWLLEGVNGAEQLHIARQQRLTVVVQDQQQIHDIEDFADAHGSATQPLMIWLKVDTGMHRLGLPLTAALHAADRLAQHDGIQLQGIMSHYACADEPTHPANAAQIAQMREIQAYTDAHASLHSSFGNSAAILNPLYQGRESASDSSESSPIDFSVGDIIRPGVSSYGLSPYADTTGVELGLTPVMTLLSRVLATRQIKAGEAVGYGHTWQANQPSLIATIGLGYGDGFCRETPNGWPVFAEHDGHHIHGELVGRVSMDLITLAFPVDSGIAVGDVVTLFGQGARSADALARHRGSLSYTTTTMLTRRIPRVPAE